MRILFPWAFARKSLQMRRLNPSVRRILGLLYPFPGIIRIADRNVLIKQRFEEGEALSNIAVDFDISPQRVWKIVREKVKLKAVVLAR